MGIVEFLCWPTLHEGLVWRALYMRFLGSVQYFLVFFVRFNCCTSRFHWLSSYAECISQSTSICFPISRAASANWSRAKRLSWDALSLQCGQLPPHSSKKKEKKKERYLGISCNSGQFFSNFQCWRHPKVISGFLMHFWATFNSFSMFQSPQWVS